MQFIRFDFTRFFTNNVAVDLGYTTSRNNDLNLDVDIIG
jgi:hypothetical protein